MILHNFVQSEIDFYLDRCNFTDIEKDLFLMRTKDKSLTEISLRLDISLDTAKQISRRVNKKILKVL